MSAKRVAVLRIMRHGSLLRQQIGDSMRWPGRCRRPLLCVVAAGASKRGVAFRSWSERCRAKVHAGGAGALLEWVDDTDIAIGLAVVEILGQEFGGTAGLGGSEDHGVPCGQLPPALEGQAETEHREGVVDHRPE